MLPFAPETLMVAALLVPLAAAVLIPLFHNAPNQREGVTLIAAAMQALIVWSLLPSVLAGERPELHVIRIADGLDLALKLEPLGMLFALVAGSLWLVNSIYSIGYMRGNDEPRQTQFYVCFAVAISATMGVAFAGNLFALFVFYEILTLSTYPLVTHKGNEDAKRGGRVYLGLLLATSMGLLLPAIVATAVFAGTIDFTPGGVLGGVVTPPTMGLLLALFAFGVGKAALMPFHFWLPAAMVAPTPVSALLHAVAVVKAGVFSVLKIVIYIFGVDALAEAGANEAMVWAAGITVILASLVALRQNNLKKRLAYSTVSQLSYVLLGAFVASAAGAIGGGMHIAMHAAGKITLFFCAGAIYTALHKTEISELDGVGRRMPITMAAFMIGAISLIGLPPMGGVWSKWMLGVGAVDSGDLAVVAVLMISSLLNIAYLMPIVARAYFRPSPDGATGLKEAPLPCLIALGFTALVSIALFFGAGEVETLVAAALEIPEPTTAIAGEWR